MLRAMGVSILQEGNILKTPQIMLEVVNACSGIRSVFSLFVLALLFCSDMKGYVQKALLLILTIPLAIFTNASEDYGNGYAGDPLGSENGTGVLSWVQWLGDFCFVPGVAVAFEMDDYILGFR